jgi:hypothetical protein
MLFYRTNDRSTVVGAVKLLAQYVARAGLRDERIRIRLQ